MKFALPLLLLVAGSAVAHDLTFTWVEPTERTDGTAIDPATEIGLYTMRCEGPQNVERSIERDNASELDDGRLRYAWQDAVQTSGVYECWMTATDTRGLESPDSNIASVPKFAAPSAPVDLEAN